MTDPIQDFLSGEAFAVVGASSNRDKYGNKVLRVYQQQDKTVFPIHPKETEIEGLQAYPDLDSLPEPVHGVSIITPPPVTETIMDDIIRLGIQQVWIQPGAESETGIRKAEQAGVNVIAYGPCILVVMGFREI